MGERSHAAKMSSGTSKFPVGNAQRQRAFESSNHKVNPNGGDGTIDVNWMGGKDNAESSRPRYRIDKNVGNQGKSDLDYWRRSRPVCQHITVFHMGGAYILLFVYKLLGDIAFMNQFFSVSTLRKIGKTQHFFINSQTKPSLFRGKA